jgi:hypothetical protein
VVELVDRLAPSTKYRTKAVERTFLARGEHIISLRVIARSQHRTPKSRKDQSLG